MLFSLSAIPGTDTRVRFGGEIRFTAISYIRTFGFMYRSTAALGLLIAAPTPNLGSAGWREGMRSIAVSG